MAGRLRCTPENLISVRLCRAPAENAESFVDDIEQIAATFAADADVLMEAVRRGQAILAMRRSAASGKTLLAARDRADEEMDNQEEEKGSRGDEL